MLVDSHCHLDFPDFAEELDAVVARAHAAGVTKMVTISTRVRQFDRIRAIAERFDSVWCSIGTHCLNAAEEPDVTLDELVRLSEHPKCVAIGEAGLDYHYAMDTKDLQAEQFRRHIAAARITGLPLVIHARDADDDVAAILEDEAGKGAFPHILHCFSSGPELARRGLATGAYLSFSGIATFKSAETIRQVAVQTPADRILVETDAPYLAPLPYRGKRNEPAYVANTARALAEARGETFEAFAQATTANFHRLFHKVSPGVSPEVSTRLSTGLSTDRSTGAAGT